MQTRLLMCYAATHLEKLDVQKQMQWQKLAKLQQSDMDTIINLEALGVPVRKRGKASVGLSFGRKRKRAVRKVGPLRVLPWQAGRLMACLGPSQCLPGWPDSLACMCC